MHRVFLGLVVSLTSLFFHLELSATHPTASSPTSLQARGIAVDFGQVGGFKLQADCSNEDRLLAWVAIHSMVTLALAAQEAVQYVDESDITGTPFEALLGDFGQKQRDRVTFNLEHVVESLDGSGVHVDVYCGSTPNVHECTADDTFIGVAPRYSELPSSIVLCPRARRLPLNIPPCSIGPPPPTEDRDPNDKLQYAGGRTLGMMMLHAYEVAVFGKVAAEITATGCSALVDNLLAHAVVRDTAEADFDDLLVVLAPDRTRFHPERYAACYAWLGSWSSDVRILPWARKPPCEVENFRPWSG
ncbi:MAG: hypothetical protein M1833_004367 [Piccolia ochrophora]|nr:MAG: hypothetical protein M1833_004367 [Piccolia ochrophora]